MLKSNPNNLLKPEFKTGQAWAVVILFLFFSKNPSISFLFFLNEKIFLKNNFLFNNGSSKSINKSQEVPFNSENKSFKSSVFENPDIQYEFLTKGQYFGRNVSYT